LQHPNGKRRFGPPKQAGEPKALVPLVRPLDEVVEVTANGQVRP
jgi:hypothetical protein